MDSQLIYSRAVDLLKKLVSTPSISRSESDTADILCDFLTQNGVENVERLKNNVWAYNADFNSQKTTILLNSHHDTVRPNAGYTRDPYAADIEDGKLYGLGSNDAGGSVVALLSAFLCFYGQKDLEYNLCIAITAEEEVSGKCGIEMILPELKNVEFAIVGEPTNMNMAVAEKGLLVLDCKAVGVSGHAARSDGDNAIYKAIKDIEWISSYRFDKVSEVFGEQRMNVTIVNGGSQHNVIPAECDFTVDVRLTDQYTHQEVFDIVAANIMSIPTARSMRLSPSSIDVSHPFVQYGIELGCKTFGSPTMSDQALMSVPSVKMGVGESSRSHSADEFIFLSEIKEGIEIYIKLLTKILKAINN